MPVRSVAVVSCHLEKPLDDASWEAFLRFRRARPGGFEVVPLVRPPHDGEDRGLWLERTRTLASAGAIGHHTHWTSPTHARPTGGDPAARVREEGEWLREQGLEPRYFCGGAWYMDEAVAAAAAALGYVDCTARGLEPCRVRLADGTLVPEAPTTHSVGQLARAVAGRLPAYVHAYFHDYDLLDGRRRVALGAALRVLALRRRRGELAAGEREVSFSEAFGR